MNTIQTPVKPTLPPVLLSLAPLDLQIHRVKRYDGGGFSLSLNQFAPKDAALLIQLYNSVKKTYGLWLDMADAPNYEVMNRQICTEFGTDRFISSIQKLGVATYALGDPSLLLRKQFTIFEAVLCPC